MNNKFLFNIRKRDLKKITAIPFVPTKARRAETKLKVKFPDDQPVNKLPKIGTIVLKNENEKFTFIEFRDNMEAYTKI